MRRTADDPPNEQRTSHEDEPGVHILGRHSHCCANSEDTMSNQSPSANGQDQQGIDLTSSEEQQPRTKDETGLSAGMEPRGSSVPSESDIEQTADPSKD